MFNGRAVERTVAYHAAHGRKGAASYYRNHSHVLENVYRL